MAVFNLFGLNLPSSVRVEVEAVDVGSYSILTLRIYIYICDIMMNSILSCMIVPLMCYNYELYIVTECFLYV